MNSESQFQDNGCIVEIILIDRNERPTRPHVLAVTSYMTPTFCDYCGEILVGLIKQGLQCAKCRYLFPISFNISEKFFIFKNTNFFFYRCNFHKKCAFAPRNNCAKNNLTAILPSTASTGMYIFWYSVCILLDESEEVSMYYALD